MVSRRLLLAAIGSSLLLGLLGIFLYAQSRVARCAAVPLLAPELLPNADLRAGAGKLPAGWGGTATISATTFTVLPGGRSLQLLGIASYAQSPDVRPVRAGQTYCFVAQALTDSPAGSPTRVQLEFQWLDGAGALVQSERTVWQDVALWRPDAPPAG
ncbi:MAG: polysaccharide deacetylase, partial [Chloroflexales bacterium]|nr:polysaccharide deacetylase [Chloroflexales bacterium]